MQSNSAEAPQSSDRIQPSHIKSRLDEILMGEEDAKSYLASIVFKHLSQTKSHLGSRSHVLVLGPTGTGKSHLIEALRRAIDVPLVTIDATTLTEVGYHGRDVDQIFDDLLREAGQDLRKAECGIVFVDEFDKLKASFGSERDIRGLGVQYSLLKILDGSVRQISGQRTSRLQTASALESQKFCTHKLLFIFAGAFSDHPELLELERVEAPDLSKLGFLHELAARIPNIICLRGLDSGCLTRALDQVDGEMLAEYSSMFAEIGCSLEFSTEAKQKISNEVLRMGIGYRGLRAVLDRTLLPLLLNIEQRVKCSARTLTRTRITFNDNGFSVEIAS